MRFGQSEASCHVSTAAQNVILPLKILSQMYACLLLIEIPVKENIACVHVVVSIGCHQPMLNISRSPAAVSNLTGISFNFTGLIGLASETQLQNTVYKCFGGLYKQAEFPELEFDKSSLDCAFNG